MTEAKLLLKYSVSACNKELLEYLHKNASTIKRHLRLTTVIIYDDMISKLESSGITSLPLLIMAGQQITGVNSIKSRLSSLASKSTPLTDSNELSDFWYKEMIIDKGDNERGDEDVMDSIKKKAVDQTMNHTTNIQQSQRKRAAPSAGREDNLLVTGGEKISDMVDDDDMMKKFWDNMEETEL
jgi:hypothetical protein